MRSSRRGGLPVERADTPTPQVVSVEQSRGLREGGSQSGCLRIEISIECTDDPDFSPRTTASSGIGFRERPHQITGGSLVVSFHVPKPPPVAQTTPNAA
jgi:hypothetical protein